MTSAQTPAQNTHLGNNFDAIRIAAASMVLLSHHYALTGQVEPSFFGIHSLGGLAVTVFFVISGYLVTASWQRDPHLWRFGLRRFLRIWPALTAVIVLTAYGLGAWVTELPLSDYLTHRATANYLRGLWMQIHFVLPGVFEHNPYPHGVNGSLWTIPIEVRCYIVLGLAGLLGLLKYRTVFLLCIGFFMLWFFARSNADVTGAVHYGRELSAFFLAGAALYVLESHWKRRPALWATVIGTVCAIAWAADWRHTALLMGLPFAVIYAGTRATPYLRRAGRWGDPSYGIYLFAFPVQQTIIYYGWPQIGFAGSLLAAFFITTLLAYASWHLIEKQALKLKPSAVGSGRWTNGLITSSEKFLALSEIRHFFLLFFCLLLLYAAWLGACWPGVLGQDSLAIMLEVDTDRQHQANKPAFWYLYALASYGTTGRVEVPAGLQLIICALVCARILSWMLARRMWKSFAYSLLCVALAPSVVYYVSSFYSDGIYAIALAGMLFELWRALLNRTIDFPGVLILLITIPFALFGRPNGVINLLPLIALLWLLPRKQKIRLFLVSAPWIFIGFGSQVIFKYSNPIGSLYPMVLYETVGFLEHRPMGHWERAPRVTAATVTALTSTGQSLEQIGKFYDHAYWDPLVFFPDGPNLLALPKQSRKIIFTDFFKYNLWNNIPAFTASRVNIFLHSAFASGDIPGPLVAKYILPQTKSISTLNYRPSWLSTRLLKWHDFSMKYRAIFWAPWVGLALVFLCCRSFANQKEKSVHLITATYLLQLVAVFFFSIAGEYRYLLGFFTAPLVLLPLLTHLREVKDV